MIPLVLLQMWFWLPPASPPSHPFSVAELASSKDLTALVFDWKPAYEDITSDDFELTLATRFLQTGYDFEEYLTLCGIDWRQLPEFCMFSPDSAFATSIFQVSQASRVGPLHVVREPDSEVPLIDLSSRRAHRVLQVGTTASFSWGTWLSPSIALIGGIVENYPNRHLAFWRIDTEQRYCAHYRGPMIPKEKMPSVLAAFSRWRAIEFPNLLE